MFYLKVPFAEKNIASGLGAKWDGNEKKWYVPSELDLEFFLKWVEEKDLDSAKKIIDSQSSDKGIKLSNLLTKVKQSVENNMNDVYWIHAEIANLEYKGKTLYLLLAETGAGGKQVCTNRAVIWDSSLEWIQNKFKMETGHDFQKGLKVLIKVKVEYSIKYQLSIVVLDIDPQFTLGGIEAKIKKIRDNLIKFNLYDKNKEKKTPEYFKNIAVVSPEDAAGLGDFRADADLLEMYGICKFNYYTAIFQGEKTNSSVSKAIKMASYDSIKKNFDIIVVIRGGGAKTDLHFLNEFDIAKEIAESNVPVFVGVGHERDKVLLDEVSNKNFDTPSKVIAYISNNNVKFYQNLNKNYKDSMIYQEKIIKQYKIELENKSKDVMRVFENVFLKQRELLNKNILEILNTSKSTIVNFKFKIDEMKMKFTMDSLTIVKKEESDLNFKYNDLNNSKKTILSNFKTDISIAVSEITARSPLNALENGYAIIKNNDGEIITSLEIMQNSTSIIVMMKDGEKTLKTGC